MSHARGRRPMLLALVYGVFLVLVGITATALVVVSSVHLTNATLAAFISRDGELIETFVNDQLLAQDVVPGAADEARLAELERRLVDLTGAEAILRIDVRDLHGRILFSSHAGLNGTTPAISQPVRAALEGEPNAALLDGAPEVSEFEGVRDVVQEFLPLLAPDAEPVAVVAIWRDAAPILARVDAASRDIVVVTVAAAVLLAAILFAVFRAAQRRLSRQQTLLLEAERRDPLTGLLNHGAVVSLLTEAVERARRSDERLGVALIDVDNFRLLNETHGHEAADEVLRRVAEVVQSAAGEGGRAARYGPDEFLLVRDAADQPAMEDAIEKLRGGLRQLSVQFGDSEPMPISASAGICLIPDHGDSVTDILSAAAQAVGEARASGGDAVRLAQVGPESRAVTGRFDVLRGLVIAVDTKDRYTKRHSEDVARYAVFLAERLGLDQETRQTIQMAGLLHDVGKIAIPDVLLRKPGRLSSGEFGIFQQHVALGDAIVRDLPEVEGIRAGIRYHHERWDGAGYLEGLEGEEIPFIGRLLAVADAFSAMTTTRPYRKALSVPEALKRLGDAAGSQLQEDLVAAFITGIETAPDAPLPGEEPALIWRLQSRVA